MTEELLTKIKKETEKEIGLLKEYNEYARLRNQLAEQETIKKELGLPHNSDLLLMPLKNENEIIMSIYHNHVGEIEEEDTKGFYYYDGTYKYVYDSWLESYKLGPMEELVPRNDTNAHFRRYDNIEGVYSYCFSLEEAEEFERTHTVLYDSNNEGVIPYWITEDFITTAVRENQEKAVSLVLKKYKTIRK